MKSFLILSLGLIVPSILVLSVFKQSALKTKYSKLQHPIVQKEFSVIAYQGGGDGRFAPNTWPAIDHSLAQSKEAIIWLDIHETKDRVPVLYGSDYLQDFSNGEGPIAFFNLDEISQLDVIYKKAEVKRGVKSRADLAAAKGDKVEESERLLETPDRIRTLEETLERYENSNFVFNILSNQAKVDLRIAELVKKFKLEKRVVITSPFGVVISSIKEKNPLWAYGLNSGESTRLLMFEALYIEPLISVEGDIFVSTQKTLYTKFNANAAKELLRRKKTIWSPPIQTLEQWQKWNQLGANGIVTRYPSRFANVN